MEGVTERNTISCKTEKTSEQPSVKSGFEGCWYYGMSDGIISASLKEYNFQWGRNFNYIVIDTTSLATPSDTFVIIPVTTKDATALGNFGTGLPLEIIRIWSVGADKLTTKVMRDTGAPYETIITGSATVVNTLKNDPIYITGSTSTTLVQGG
jgi:hypothetical protein